MRPILFLPYLATALMASCAPGDRAFTNPLTGLQNAITTPQMQRGAVELAVKSNFNAMISDIDAGGGPALTEVFETAGVPPQDRPTRIIQLNSDLATYAGNPSALINVMLLYGTNS